MGLNLGVLKRYLISIYTIKGWYDIARSDCTLDIEAYLVINFFVFYFNFKYFKFKEKHHLRQCSVERHLK